MLLVQTMIGQQVTLQDILLEELPEPISLLCDEQLPSEEELEQEEQVQCDTYRVQVLCPHCDEILCVAIHCSQDTVRRLEQLLLQDLRFVCRQCATSNYHGF